MLQCVNAGKMAAVTTGLHDRRRTHNSVWYVWSLSCDREKEEEKTIDNDSTARIEYDGHTDRTATGQEASRLLADEIAACQKEDENEMKE